MITRKISILSRFLTLPTEHRKTVVDYLTVYLRETGAKDRKAIVAKVAETRDSHDRKEPPTLTFLRQLRVSDHDALDVIVGLVCPNCAESISLMAIANTEALHASWEVQKLKGKLARLERADRADRL